MFSDHQLREYYLEDLTTPDPTHDREQKVSNLQPWRNIAPFAGTKREFDPFTQRVWIWSDIHFWHKNVIKYTAPFRPFETVEEMNNELIARYCSVVQPNDVSIWLGDIGFGRAAIINDILDTLPGYKIWIVGNHDIDRKGNVLDLHFDERHIALPVNISDPRGLKYQLLLTHYPLSKVPRNAVNVHGHIHQHTAEPWNINVCVEHTSCSPINLLTVCDRAHAYLTNG